MASQVTDDDFRMDQGGFDEEVAITRADLGGDNGICPNSPWKIYSVYSEQLVSSILLLIKMKSFKSSTAIPYISSIYIITRANIIPSKHKFFYLSPPNQV